MNHHLHFIEKAFRKQRADRAVNQARGQCFEFAGAAFAFEKTAGNTASSIRFFKIVNSQRKKVLAWLGIKLCNDGCQHHGAIHVQHDRAARLARDFASFHRDGVLAPLERFCNLIENAHGLSPLMTRT